ncbi:hypothetical protein Pcinc_019454 [Petrolisthes cinctipes]|uniref:Uncharacterized protein n=1 Tax=Petrolisthes cinctipes TaxID=88211 RepID=A0AAE1FM41_PETCI|nr:hypothetical protein Pcinc_019454 [Petrolisthes cinctipes]
MVVEGVDECLTEVMVVEGGVEGCLIMWCLQALTELQTGPHIKSPSIRNEYCGHGKLFILVINVLPTPSSVSVQLSPPRVSRVEVIAVK